MSRKRWTDNEINILDTYYSSSGALWVANKLGRTFQSVCKKAYFLRIHRNVGDLTGKRFGHWTVIRKSEKRSGGNTYWLCQCDCGNEVEVQRQALRHHKSTKCIKCATKTIKVYENIPLSYFHTLVRRSKNKNIEFTLTIQAINDLYIKQNGKCALSGVSVGFFVGEGKYKSLRNHTASLDRIDSSRGYVYGNVQWVHGDINLMKNIFIQEHFVTMCHAVSQHMIALGWHKDWKAEFIK